MRFFRKKKQPLQRKTKDRMTLAKGEKLIIHEKESMYHYQTITGNKKGIESKELSFINPVTGERESTVQFWIRKKQGGMKSADIKWVATTPGFRGEGLAKKLLEEAVKKAKEEGADYAILRFAPLENAEAAERVYRKTGFVPLSEVPSEVARKYIGGRYDRMTEDEKREVFVLLFD